MTFTVFFNWCKSKRKLRTYLEQVRFESGKQLRTTRLKQYLRALVKRRAVSESRFLGSRIETPD